jgi:U3 small nucleolar RNA-associated protein 13
MTIDQSGTLVALGSADSTIQIYHITKGYCTHNFKRHGGVVSALKFYTPHKTADTNQIWLASGANDNKIILWDLKTSRYIATFNHHGSVIRGLDFSADGEILLAGSRDKTVSLWNTKTKEIVKSIALYESVEDVGFIQSNESDKPTQFYTGGESGLLKIWDVESGEELITQVQEGTTSHQIVQTLYLEDTQQLVAVTDDHNMIFYSVENNLNRVKQIVGYNEEIIDLKLLEYTYNNEEHSHLLVASNSEQLKVIDLSTSCTDLLFGHSDIVVSLATNPSGTIFASGSKDNTARVWRANVGSQLSFECLAQCVGHNEAVGAMALSKKATGPQYLVTGSEDLTVKLWEYTDYIDSDLDDEEIPRLQSKYTFRAHDKSINCVTFSPNDKLFATASQDKTVKVWNTADGTLLGTCTGHRRGVWSVEFSPVEQIMVTSSGDKTVKIWSLKDFSCLKTFEGHTNTVLRASFLSSGLQIVSCGADGLVKLWTIKNNECVATLDGHTEKVILL